MKISNKLKHLLPLVAALLLSGSGAMAQTIRGDFNMDGQVSVADVSSMIDCLLSGSLGELTAADRDTITVDGIPIVMVRVEGGYYYSRDAGVVKTVENDFWLAQTEVTNRLWDHLMGDSDSEGGYNRARLKSTWYQWQEFITKLNEKTGRNFRMPTSQEWEYAALGGKLTMGYKYAGGDDVDEVAWHSGNASLSASTTPNVATKAPNELGIYDMSGNAEEWCQDVYYWEGVGYCVFRGGSVFNDASYCIPTNEYRADGASYRAGLRLAL